MFSIDADCNNDRRNYVFEVYTLATPICACFQGYNHGSEMPHFRVDDLRPFAIELITL